MGFARNVKEGFKSRFNFKKWSGFEYIAESGEHLFELGRSIFQPRDPQQHETFEESLRRLNLTEEDLKNRAKEFSRLVLIFLCFAFALLGYAVYLAWCGSVGATLMCFGMMAFCFGQVFRFHFWLFQVRERRLGCSLREWYHSSIKGAPTGKGTQLERRDE